MLLIAGAVVCDLGMQLRAEWYLRQAARRAAVEASLPRATIESTNSAARRALAGLSRLEHAVQLTTLVNGRMPPSNDLDAVSGDVVSVRLCVPAAVVTPDWLQCRGLSPGSRWLMATVARRKP